jgi:4-hydroxybenzoyl-CoA thioesterase
MLTWKIENRNNVMPAQASRRRVKVEFGDCDPAQIAYYPNLIVWVDHSTHHLFEAAGFPLRGLQAGRGIQVPVVGLKRQVSQPGNLGGRNRDR